MTPTLSPAQQQAYVSLLNGLPIGSVFVLHGGTGRGKTTVLRAVHSAIGGAFLTMKDFVDALRVQHPLAMEETFEQMLLTALTANDTVILDDLNLVSDVVCGCSGFSAYPRPRFLEAPLTMLTAYAAEAGKKLVFGADSHAPDPIHQRAYYFGIAEFQPADYDVVCRTYLGDRIVDRLDFPKIHRFAPKLNAHQLKGAAAWLHANETPSGANGRHATASPVDTERFIDYLRSQRMVSNVDLGEVQAVDIHDLKGVDDIIESLEANIILPLENDEMATELGIKPKRGVLLAGPPGTGKTTIGRALAHRLKSKFFLVDGTFISGTQNFYQQIFQVFEAAKQNAPSIIFLDDSDVIFESGEEMGLYRYLLTMLDGLESESAGRVCLMMTAMDVGNLPPALIRSGRIELWLETRLPDAEARTAILEQHLASLASHQAFGEAGSIDVDRIAGATEGLTGADIKRLIEDGKILFAYDRALGRPLRPITDYFLAALETVRANKERYVEAEARARQQRPARPPWFDMFGGAMMQAFSIEEE